MNQNNVYSFNYRTILKFFILLLWVLSFVYYTPEQTETLFKRIGLNLTSSVTYTPLSILAFLLSTIFLVVEILMLQFDKKTLKEENEMLRKVLDANPAILKDYHQDIIHKLQPTHSKGISTEEKV